ncbi:MAG: hypothetical protein QG602_1511, partial [Verrucomicrobiota bacterium]|nr:hypothetical protein [Verrucomicrobiota bacterium]
RLLTEGQVRDQMQKIMAAPIGDGVRTLDTLAKSYGEHWPRAFGDLVKHGKLSPEYQVLASMDHPAQVMAAGDLQDAMKLMAAKGGKAALETSARMIDPAVETTMKVALNSALLPFHETMRGSSSRVQFFDSVYNSAHTLALYYMDQRGEGATQAAQRAVDGIINSKWGTSGTMLFPKEQRNEVLRATAQVQRDLTADRIAVPPVSEGAAGTTEQFRLDVELRNARSGKWYPNATSTGLVLVAPKTNGAMLPVIGRDGKPVQVLFNALPAPSGTDIDVAPVADPRRPMFGRPGGDPLSVLGGAAP